MLFPQIVLQCQAPDGALGLGELLLEQRLAAIALGLVRGASSIASTACSRQRAKVCSETPSSRHVSATVLRFVSTPRIVSRFCTGKCSSSSHGCIVLRLCSLRSTDGGVSLRQGVAPSSWTGIPAFAEDPSRFPATRVLSVAAPCLHGFVPMTTVGVTVPAEAPVQHSEAHQAPGCGT